MRGRVKELIFFPLRHRRLTLLLALFVCVVAVGIANFWAWQQFRAAERALRRDRLDEARNHINNCLRIWSRGPESHLLLARIERSEGRFREARREWSECVRLQGGESEASQLEEILQRAEQGELATVEAGLWKLVDGNHPQSTQILETLAHLYLQQSRTQLALIALNRWLERDPEAVRAWHWRGWLYEYLDGPDLATADYRQALGLDPQRDGTRLRLARLLLAQQSVTEALQHFLVLQRNRPEDLDVKVLLAECYQLRKEEDQSVALLDEVLAARPDYEGALSLRGRIAFSQGHAEEAEVLLRRALTHHPSDVLALYTLSRSLRQQNKEKEAAEALARYKAVEADISRRKELLHALAQSPTSDPETLVELSSVSFRLGEEAVGRKWLHCALQIDPKNAEALKLLKQHSQFSVAVQPGQRSVDTTPRR